MMRGVKHALAFLFGAAYASGWWLTAMWWDYPPLDNGANPWKLPYMFVAITSFFLLVVFLRWLVENWDKE